ncbi:MAG: alpha-amylase [Prevotella sp.]|nr:alpha-amylase [Prevotella sp.]
MESSKKIIVYQIFTRLFGNRNDTCKPNGTVEQNGCGKMNDIDAKVLRQIRAMGVSHVWFTGIIRHATQTDYSKHGIPRQHPDVVKGKAGSPYAITDYYDVDPDLAVDVDHRMEEFEQLVERTHKAGMKVIIDFVPNHVAREYHSICKPAGVKDLGEGDDVNMHFSTRNNFYYCWGQTLQLGGYTETPAKATGNDVFSASPSQNDWYETVKLNYGIDYCDAGGRSEHFSPIPNTWGKMTDILLFWAAKGIDGFRCDMAEMVPAAFWAWATDKVKFRYPDKLFIGEVYDPNQYRNYIGAGFDYLYDKVGMYDCVRDVICHRRRAADITAQWQQTDDIRRHMLYFLENHDEQRIASTFFADDARRGIPGLLVSALFGQNPFMFYAGQEVGEPGMDAEGFSGCDGRTTIFDYWSVATLRRAYFDRRRMTKDERALETVYQKVLRLAAEEPAVSDGQTYDLMYVNPQLADRQFAFLRSADNELLVVVANFDDQPVSTSVQIPRHAFEFLRLPQTEVTAIDLLTGSEHKLLLYADTPIAINVPANDGVVLKVVFK